MPSGRPQYYRQFVKLLIIASIVCYGMACAVIVGPTGGIKDIIPPKMVSSVPNNLSTNFKGDKLVFNFDEYVILKTPEKFLLISPPLGKVPDIKIKGHSVIVKLEDSLRSNTTYNFYFGEAIVDLTENNPIPNFNFAFSTGPEIDSLSLSGNLTDAFTRMPAKNAFVMLYEDFTDSLPMKQIPMYVSRANDNGDFRFNSLAPGKFRAVALTDGNNDYMYNLPTEMIGFNTDSVQPYYSVYNPKDTTAVISDEEKQKLVSINLFPEPDSTQRILKSVIAAHEKLSVAFRYPMTAPGFRALNVPDSLPWSIQEWNPANDTLSAWLLNKPDTLQLQISEKGIVIDTIIISTALKVTGKPKANLKPPPLKYSTSLSGGKLGYNSPLILTFANPVKLSDLSAIKLGIRTAKDTTEITPVSHFTDSVNRHLLIEHKWNTTDIYDLYIPENSFTDIYRDTCDSTRVVFQMKPLEEYGQFKLKINRQDMSYPVIIQLITDKGQVVKQQIITVEKQIDFGLINPGKYGLKAIMDANKNGRWDTGVFIKKIQPERVLIHPKKFDLKANWELEEDWNL